MCVEEKNVLSVLPVILTLNNVVTDVPNVVKEEAQKSVLSN